MFVASTIERMEEDTDRRTDYWGVWFDDGRIYDWVVDDDFGLSYEQALVLAVRFNIHWGSLVEVDYAVVAEELAVVLWPV